MIGSHVYLRRLVDEVTRNPDFRLMKKPRGAAKAFPKKRSLESRLLSFLESERNIFPHQEAECFRALRYLAKLSDETLNRARTIATNSAANGYLRVQATYLLYRTLLTRQELVVFHNLFDRERDPFVQSALCGLLVQRTRNNDGV